MGRIFLIGRLHPRIESRQALKKFEPKEIESDLGHQPSWGSQLTAFSRARGMWRGPSPV